MTSKSKSVKRVRPTILVVDKRTAKSLMYMKRQSPRMSPKMSPSSAARILANMKYY
jgi:hypothetical protein